MTAASNKSKSYFGGLGFQKTLAEMEEDLRALYLSDETPWVIGYSGGKDSTAVVQLVWNALASMDVDQRNRKPIFVITTDTLVENPIVATWVNASIQAMNLASKNQQMPFNARLLEPEVHESFWVNLIGRGYPAPRNGFRWCTERLKIKPSSKFIRDTASEFGETILLIGARKAESAVRAASIKRRSVVSKQGLTAHDELPNTLVHSPIQDWTDDDVWTFLTLRKNPWKHSNKELLSMYRGATEDNECPVVVDTSTPSCGNSRFGCWVCTLVDQDKSMQAMIRNDEEKNWMQPFLDFRNELDFRGDEGREKDHARRDFVRRNGRIQLNRDKTGIVRGPYTQEAREEWLRWLLRVQRKIRDNPKAPDHFKTFEIITISELQEIRRQWLEFYGEIEDLVPVIYEEELGMPYPAPAIEENLIFDQEALDLLRQAAGDDVRHYKTLRNLLNIERRFSTMNARHGIFGEIEKTIKTGLFKDIDDATRWVMERLEAAPDGFDVADEPMINEIPSEKKGAEQDPQRNMIPG